MHRDPKRFYQLLEIAPDASDEDVRSAFRRRAKELHPDSETGDAGAFIQLKRAYDVLSTRRKRASYDRASQPRRRRQPLPPMPELHRPRRMRIGGMSVARFTAAFLFMAGLSVAALEVILDSSGAPVGAIFQTSAPEPIRKQSTLRQPDEADPATPASDDPSREPDAPRP